MTSCRVYSIVKHRFSLFFIESVVFIFNKTTKLHLLTLFQKNYNYPTWTTWLCSFPNFLELFVTERTFLVQKTSLFFSDHIQKIKLGMQKMSDSWPFGFFSLRSSTQAIIKNCENPKVKLFNKICRDVLKENCYAKNVFCKITLFNI